MLVKFTGMACSPYHVNCVPCLKYTVNQVCVIFFKTHVNYFKMNTSLSVRAVMKATEGLPYRMEQNCTLRCSGLVNRIS